ncbi:MAG: hypothetical protein MUE47_11190 [Acidobacteria bacterium]|nr:hypothetical protein [Acidobacteriota bacterium]
MAVCPECGGRVFPGLLSSLKPSATYPCRWCNAVLRWSAGGRLLRDALLCGGLVAALAVPLWLRSQGNSALWLEALLAGVALVVAAVWLVGDLIPLHTVRPRTVFPAGDPRASGRRRGE